MCVRVAVLSGLLVVALLFTSDRSPGQQPPGGPPEVDTRAKIRELEARVARLEKLLAATPPAAPVAPEAVPFGDVVVNLKVDSHNRYLRVKIALTADAPVRQEVAGAVTRKRAELRSWLISHLSDQTLKDVSGSAGVDRLRDAVKREFGRILFPGRAPNPIREVLFEEYIVQ